VPNGVIRRRVNTGQEKALPHGVVDELHTYEREHTNDRDDHQHQHDAEGDYPLLYWVKAQDGALSTIKEAPVGPGLPGMLGRTWRGLTQ
jgi:ABC-type Zn2+ transport system substrate-binding protein/surface adhesin